MNFEAEGNAGDVCFRGDAIFGSNEHAYSCSSFLFGMLATFVMWNSAFSKNYE